MNKVTQSCPCCGHLTLCERGAFELCPVCCWEDDRQDDVDAHIDRGGPNGRMTLWQARANFLRFGACEEGAGDVVRRPAPDEPRVRQWFLLDDVAVELIPWTDVSPWNLLHDGSIVGLERRGERVSVLVEAQYLRERFQEPGVAFRLELLECSELEYARYDEMATSDLDEMMRLEPEIGSATNENGRLVVWSHVGKLSMRYGHLALRFDSGAPLALAALQECARSYWDDWERRHREPSGRKADG